MLLKIDELNKTSKTVITYQGEEKHITKAKANKKFLARERIELLLDPRLSVFRTIGISRIRRKRWFWKQDKHGIALVLCRAKCV